MSTVIEMAVASHRGMLRARNEDFAAAEPAAGLAVLADGMGGHNAGEVASRMAVEVITEGVVAATGGAHGPPDARTAQALISGQISRANRRIYESAHQHGAYAGMGTTVVVALWHDGALSVGYVGDSRLYRLRQGALEQLTRDHSLAQQHVDQGRLAPAEARSAPTRNILTRAVGSQSHVSADLATYPTCPDDLYMLCSDGLTEMLSDDQIRQALGGVDDGLEQVAGALVQQANDRGGVDNISVILARVVPVGSRA